MTLGERIKLCRQSKGMSQEKVAEFVGVSRQAVTKWEANLSAPSTDNLFKLAEILGTTVDLLLDSQQSEPSSTEQPLHPHETEEGDVMKKKQQQKKNILTALLIASGYLFLYFLGRVIWCDLWQSNWIGWLFTVRPAGEHSYLYGWLLSSNIFWYAAVISVIPAFWGKYFFSYATLFGFVAGLLFGTVFGPNPEGAQWGFGHYGWAIWGAIFLIAIIVGIFMEHYKKKKTSSIYKS